MASRSISTHVVQAVHEETHFRVLRLLEANPRMNQRELASALGVSLGKTNYCLRALIDKGLVKMQNFRNSDRKLAYAYLLTPVGLAKKAELTARFLRRKVAEYEAIRREIRALKSEIARIDNSR
jgi:EPS-associated MarR family transcriptional regulator